MRVLREIIDEILVALNPLPPGHSERQVRRALINDVKVLTKTAPLWQKISVTKVSGPARRLSSAITELDKSLREAPGTLIFRIFMNPDSYQNKKNTDDILHELNTRANFFLEQLKRMRAICETAGRSRDQDPRSNYEKAECAHVAYILMKKLSLNKITGTSSGPFFDIAALLYEAVSGEQDANMKRACDAVLRLRIRTSL